MNGSKETPVTLGFACVWEVTADWYKSQPYRYHVICFAPSQELAVQSLWFSVLSCCWASQIWMLLHFFRRYGKINLLHINNKHLTSLSPIFSFMNDVLYCDSVDVSVRLSDDSEHFVAEGILKSDALHSCFCNVWDKLKSQSLLNSFSILSLATKARRCHFHNNRVRSLGLIYLQH